MSFILQKQINKHTKLHQLHVQKKMSLGNIFQDIPMSPVRQEPWKDEENPDDKHFQDLHIFLMEQKTEKANILLWPRKVNQRSHRCIVSGDPDQSDAILNLFMGNHSETSARSSLKKLLVPSSQEHHCFGSFEFYLLISKGEATLGSLEWKSPARRMEFSKVFEKSLSLCLSHTHTHSI